MTPGQFPKPLTPSRSLLGDGDQKTGELRSGGPLRKLGDPGVVLSVYPSTPLTSRTKYLPSLPLRRPPGDW